MKKSALFVVLLLAVVGAVAPFYLQSPVALEQNQLKRFFSYEELKNFVKESSQAYPYYDKNFLVSPLRGSAMEAGSTVPSYSTTNVQVEGVDEADIIKTDGEFIYVASGNNVTIVRAYPPEGAEVLSRIGLNGTVVGIFINGERLVVFEQPNPYILVRPLTKEKPVPYETFRASIKVYDISDRRSPALRREVALDGWYFNSRMMGDYVYAVVNQPVIRPSEGEDKVILPKVYVNGGVKEISASEIYYSDVVDYSYTFTTVVALNVQNDGEKPTYKTILMGVTSSMYVSRDNIYVAIPKWTTSEVKTLGSLIGRVTTLQVGKESTVIYRIHVEGPTIEIKASGEVPGRVLNQFSMDEYNGNFRIATTTGQVWSSEEPSRNHVYVLNMNLNIIGRLEDLAPGETIYSARFMGERGYLVTFKKVDPLFVIDLKEPANPRVLGQLKITGYSDYLHPYDETHIIGIGKETVEAEEGNFAWYQGVKISLFDVSDVKKPKEIAKYEIGDRGTDSPILRDHHALLFDQAKNLLVLPVLVAEIDPEKYPNGVPPYIYGDYVWQGAYVFHVSQSGELVLRGRITHLESNEDLVKSGYYFYSSYSVKRSLYIGNVLYTISDKVIKMNSLGSLAEINKVDLS